MNTNTSLDFDALKSVKSHLYATETSEANLEAQGASAPSLPSEPTRWPSRQASASDMVQMTVRAHIAVADEFRRLCKEERYSYGNMLKILLDHYRSNKIS